MNRIADFSFYKNLLSCCSVAEDEGLAVNTLADSGVLLVCAYLDLVKGAVVGVCRVVCALSYTAFDTLVRVMLIHFSKVRPFNKFEIL